MALLLVEDNPDHAELVRRCVSDARPDAEVRHVADGQEALDYLLRKGAWADPERSPRPKLVLLDLRLPRVDGFEILKRLKEHPSLCHVPVIVLTTSSAEGDIRRAYELRANSYIVKPADFEEFHRLMADLGRYWLGWNKEPERGPARAQ